MVLKNVSKTFQTLYFRCTGPFKYDLTGDRCNDTRRNGIPKARCRPMVTHSYGKASLLNFEHLSDVSTVLYFFDVFLQSAFTERNTQSRVSIQPTQQIDVWSSYILHKDTNQNKPTVTFQTFFFVDISSLQQKFKLSLT